MHGNLDGREMKQAVTQRTSQLPLLLVAGNSMATEDFFALTSEASVKPVPVSLPACLFQANQATTAVALAKRRWRGRGARRQACKAGGMSQARAGLNCLPSFLGPIGVYSAALAASPLVATAAPNLASDDGASSRRYDSCS